LLYLQFWTTVIYDDLGDVKIGDFSDIAIFLSKVFLDIDILILSI